MIQGRMRGGGEEVKMRYLGGHQGPLVVQLFFPKETNTDCMSVGGCPVSVTVIVQSRFGEGSLEWALVFVTLKIAGRCQSPLPFLCPFRYRRWYLLSWSTRESLPSFH